MGVIIVLVLVLVLFTISITLILEERKNVVIDLEEYTDDASVLFDDDTELL